MKCSPASRRTRARPLRASWCASFTEDPRPVAETRPSVPKHVRAVVSKGLEKLPADRFKSAGEFKDALDDTAFTYERVQVTGAVQGVSTAGTSAPSASGGARGRVRGRIHTAATVMLAAATGWLALSSRPGPEARDDAPVVSFVMLDSAGQITSPVAGPDGTIAFIRRGELFVQSPGALEPTPISGIADAAFATFSPDGAWIAFTTEAAPQSLRKDPHRRRSRGDVVDEQQRGGVIPVLGRRWLDLSFDRLLRPDQGDSRAGGRWSPRSPLRGVFGSRGRAVADRRWSRSAVGPDDR